MKKKHIITIGYLHFAVDSVSAATQLVNLLSRVTRVKRKYSDDSSKHHWEPDEEDRDWSKVELTMNQSFKPAPAAKPEPKALALPAPKRGSILCICEKSYVAPRQSCPHCGRGFAESHNRTHSSDNGPNLRLL